MSDSVRVTVRCNRFERDMELPLNVSLGVLYPKLLPVLQSLDWLSFSSETEIVLAKDMACMLNMKACLLDYGILNGDYLDIVFVKET